MADVINKLVRNGIPDIIAQDGKSVTISKLVNDDEFISALHAKLDEEVAEYHESRDSEELADIIEVVLALGAYVHRLSEKELMRNVKDKFNDCGGFSRRYFLKEIN